MKSAAKVLALPIIALISYLAVRLADQSLMLYYFPMDGSSQDWCSHIANLFFLGKYGFHASVPNWYGGDYVLFKYYPFLWHIFSYPFLAILKSPAKAAFASLIVMYFAGFAAVWKFGSITRISRISRIAFFAFFFANPVAIGVFLKLGKLPEMFGWLWFFALACLLYYYKEKPAGIKFALLFTALWTGLFYSHVLVFIVSFVFVAGFFFYKLLRKDFGFVLVGIACGISVAALASPLWKSLLEASDASKYAINQSTSPLSWLLAPGLASNLNDKIFSTAAPLAFLLLLAIYFYANKSKNELLFYSLPAAFAIIYLTRLPARIPIINNASPDMYGLLFLFYALAVFFKTDFGKVPVRAKKLIIFLVIVLPIFGVGLSAWQTPWYSPHSEAAADTIGLLGNVDGNFLTVNPPASEVRGACAYSYGAIYENAKTPLGWSPIAIPKEKYGPIKNLLDAGALDDCEGIRNAAADANVTNLIFYGKHCEALSSCFGRKFIETNACLFKL